MRRAPQIRVLLADDHTLVAEGLARLIESDFDLVAKVDNGWEAVTAAAKCQPDVALLDISMPVLNGIEAARRILEKSPNTKIIFITMHADLTYAREALRAGASGYILKSSATTEIAAAIRNALEGKQYITPLLHLEGHSLEKESLTPRQSEVLELVAEGRSAKDIAHRLGISIKTVEYHKQVLMQKLKVHTAVELAKYAIQKDLGSK